MYYVYVIQSERDKRYYIGYTSNLEKRLNSHNTGLQRWTRSRGPWKLVYSEYFINKRDAIIRERGLKNKKSHKAIENIVHNNDDKMRG
ncbi:MAG: GIY-YIG nuclease family protein [Planctomycetota bacterium]